MKLSESQEREEFEAWKQVFIQRNPAMPDLYHNEATQIAWMAWKERGRMSGHEAEDVRCA